MCSHTVIQYIQMGGVHYNDMIVIFCHVCDFRIIADMTKNHNHVIITNQGRGESVLINIEDYAKYEEFLHQRYVAEELAKAKQQAADPNTQWEDHDSVWGMLNKEYGL